MFWDSFIESSLSSQWIVGDTTDPSRVASKSNMHLRILEAVKNMMKTQKQTPPETGKETNIMVFGLSYFKCF